MTGTVRAIYLVSNDRTVKREYTDAIWNALVDVRWWFRRQLGGPTFQLRSAVEIVRSSRPASWFSSPASDESRQYERALAEVARHKGARHNDPNNCWVIYSDGPGTKGRGTSGVCMMPEDDLLGLTGRHPTQKSKSRWIGGLAHELGHAMGLPHPKDHVRDKNAIMWAGFYKGYPNGAYLTDADKKILLRSPYISGGSVGVSAGLSGVVR